MFSVRSVRVVVTLLVALTAPTAFAAKPEALRTAERLGEEAYELQAAGKYPEAIGVYLKAYELSQATAILYNVASIYDRKLHERELAATYYRRYASATDAEPALVKKALERLAALKKESEAEAQALPKQPEPKATPPAETAPPESPTIEQKPAEPRPVDEPKPKQSAKRDQTSSSLRGVGVGLGITGVAALGTGVVLGFVAKQKNDDADKVCNGSACQTQQGVELAESAGDFATAGTITGIAGAVLLGTGIVLYAVAPSRSAETQNGSKPLQVRTTGLGLRLEGSF